jgi:NAD+ kinase
MDPDCGIAKEFASQAAALGLECGCTLSECNVKTFDTLVELAVWADMFVVIGGDGTILNIVEVAAKKDVPILAVHNGNLGFLTEIQTFETKKALKLIAGGKYEIEERVMVETEFDGETYIALNEILISRRNRSGVCRLSAHCDDVYFDTYTGDGVMVSTPTGSTAYSMSAGGPVLSPKIDALLLTPLCVHAFNSKSIVFDGDETLRITVDGKDDHNCIHVDGKQLSQDVAAGSSFDIRKSKYKTKFVRFSEKSFYARMYSKLESWSRR